MKKLTTEQFIEKAKKMNGDKYDYSLVKYENSKNKVKIICPVHGIFEQFTNIHIICGCPKCENNKTEKFIEKAKFIHGDKYDYSLVDYKNSNTKVKIICPTHGIFEQLSYSHLKGNKCSNCKNVTNEKFIEKAKLIHGEKYNYSLVEYKNNYTKIKIICTVHGIFEQTPNSHISDGQGCSECYGNKKLTNERFIIKSNKIHDNKYDYSLVDYKNNSTKVKIICPIHGVFYQSPDCHFNRGCDKCGGTATLTTEEFVKKAKLIHGDKYDYSLVDYKNNSIKIKIICKKHGIFYQEPSNHINHNSGCPMCIESRGEKEIKNFLEYNNIIYESQKKFNNCIYKKNLKFDFYLPNYNICIEYDGEQHFNPVIYWGGVDNLNEIIVKDEIKNNYCKNNNITLVRIKYDEDTVEKLTESLIDQNRYKK